MHSMSRNIWLAVTPQRFTVLDRVVGERVSPYLYDLMPFSTIIRYKNLVIVHLHKKYKPVSNCSDF